MNVVIRDAMDPRDTLTIDDNGGDDLLYVAASSSASPSIVLALDFEGATRLAEVLIPFLRGEG